MSQKNKQDSLRDVQNPIRQNVVFFEHEGQTEKNYLQKLHQIIKELDLNINFEYGKGGGKDPKTCVQNLIKQKRNCGRDGDLFIAICDVDKFDENNRSGKKSILQQAINLAQQNNINLLISNICFEQWLEFHISEKQYFEDQSIKKQLTNIVIKDREFIKKNINNAYRRAKNLDDESCEYPRDYGSRVWKLFEILKENFPNLKIIQ